MYYLFLPFFCLDDIYRPNLGKVWLGRPNPNQHNSLNFYLKWKKKHILLRIVCTTTSRLRFSISSSLIFKKYIKKFSKKPVKMFNYIYNNNYFFLNQTAKHCWSLCGCQRNLFHQVVMANEWFRLVWNFKNPTFGKTYLNSNFTMKMNQIHICIICINNLY